MHQGPSARVRAFVFFSTAIWFGLAAGLLTACEQDSVEPNGFVRDGAVSSGTGGIAGAAGGGAAGSGAPAVDAGLGAGGTGGSGGSVAAGDCNLEGRWLVAQRVLATAIGQDQAAHNWFYYEIRQGSGGALTVAKGLHCGFEVVKKTGLAASVDSSQAWPAFLAHNSSAGRKGTFVKEGAGCHLKLDKEYVVRGATVPHYLDPAVKLPDKAAKADGANPGWEDWDGDGNPGISLKVTSTLASGTLYACQRDWTVYDGAVTGGPKFKVSITFGSEQIPLGRSEGSASALESSSSPSSAAAQHYAWFHRLDAGQAVGTDAEICAAIRTLKNQLVPEAND